MSTSRVSGPAWFPEYARSCMQGILLLRQIPKEGIFFIKYPHNWAEEITGLLKSFFTIKSDGDYVRYDDDSEISGRFNGELLAFIKNESFFAGNTYSFKVTPLSSSEHKINLLQDGGVFPITNPSHKTVLQAVLATNLLLKENTSFVCFQIDTDCFDEATSNIIYKIFEFLNQKIGDQKKNLIVFYSDANNNFDREFLWKKSCCKSFAIIESETAYRILDYEAARKKIEEALEDSNYKRVELFLGAGAGIASGLPSGRDLRLMALQELVGDDKNENEEILLREANKIAPEIPSDIREVSLELVMSVLKKQGITNLTRTKAMRYFQEKHPIAMANPSEGYKLLKEIADKNISVLCVTTNFDQLTESNLPTPTVLFDDPHFESNDFDAIIKGNPKHVVVKLHGCNSFQNTLGIELDNIKKLPPHKEEFMRAYKTDSRPDGSLTDIFFVGYDFTDQDVLDVLARNPKNAKICPVVVNPFKTPAIESFMAKFVEIPGGPTHIPFTFDFFMKVLKEIIWEKNGWTS